MLRFYYPIPFIIGQYLYLPDNIVNHLNVLRVKYKNTIILFNGFGGEYIAKLISIKKKILIQIISFLFREIELPYTITLVQALPENRKFDLIIEKSVELGVKIIQPIITNRCIIQLNNERIIKKRIRWKNIIISATEQSGRNILPVLAPNIYFNNWLISKISCARILLSPRGRKKLSCWANNQSPQEVELLIGPEGGFTEKEENLAYECGVIILSLGKRILRTETASLVALAILNGVWGEM
ncbi:16S rRNA (uracil(1498)-N(3))-methyltransferase [Candidatus Profftella armatura]|uniref:Ribosomal RNA small subunit methyltransferase E n=1 Tax=Candidatus Profftella armatura TaxID=669502 RepID=S5R8Y5_9PROT|nr:16S rRNA (uracil(1498)-N(3))-methyltransferase [Candidatus Profftella armatura]AGS07060.1 16S ribosomal RNA methyltransferase RsmE [Candidatus Profftella armatura]ALC96111.1 16S rRNA methyltransferase [Candidatus Profftella armatura]QLK13952.1 16S rRNA (uracil(1498)-N(3))-methyltransferase [Candidatus Profftella armatura]